MKLLLSCILVGAAGIGITAGAWPLDSVLYRGDSCIAIAWTPDSHNTNPAWYIQYGDGCIGVDTIYRHCDFVAGRTYNGVAYSYGGEDPWYLFRERVADGFLVGSHLCHYQAFGDPTPVVTGTDCSGFLCFIWNVSRMSTSAMVASPAYEHIARSAIRPGDALVRSGYHAVFVVEADDLTQGLIWEASSSVFSCRPRITDLTGSAWDLYTPLRNPQIASDAVERPGREARKEFQPVRLRQARSMLRVQSFVKSIRGIEIFDPAGRRVLDAANRTGALEQTILLAGFASGVYEVVVRFQDGGVCSERMLLHGPW
jgi:hypothetical protein